jgi:hypothetical protein
MHRTRMNASAASIWRKNRGREMEEKEEKQMAERAGDYLLSMWLGEAFRSLHKMWTPEEHEDAGASG